MKAKSRRRLLISSIAMLLVAMLALGTATFAWFTSSTTATASGIKVKTIKASELVISKSDLQWNTTVDYAKEEVFTPVSTVDGNTWYEANAKTKNSYEKDADDNFATATGETGHYFTEALNVGNRGDAAVANVTITITGLDCNYARLAIYRVTANNGTTGYDTDNAFAKCVYDSANSTTYAAVSGATTTQDITTKDSKSITVGTLNGKAEGQAMGDVAYYKLYVWFEGQDTDCVDANAGASFSTLTKGLTFTVSGDTVTT